MFFLIFIGMPCAMVISGLYNGIVLLKNKCPFAAKINFIMAIIAFVILGTCLAMLG